jgi:nucleoside-diphosphate kinase
LAAKDASATVLVVAAWAACGLARTPARHLSCAAMDRTLVICKPDAVERGLVGEIIGRLEAKGLKLVAAELRRIDEETAGRHYEEHQGKPFYPDLVAFITRSPSMLMVVEGPGDTFKVVRTLMGVTNPKEAAPGTIRGDLAIETTENLVHGSDSPESAGREIGIFFPSLAG